MEFNLVGVWIFLAGAKLYWGKKESLWVVFKYFGFFLLGVVSEIKMTKMMNFKYNVLTMYKIRVN
jgi:hypothetical protein